MLREPTPPPIPLGKPILSSYPTPELGDRIFRVRKDNRVADYEVPTPGDPYTGIDADKLEGFQFATATPINDPSTIGLVDHWFVNQRANQDDYNASLEYPYADLDFPRVIRTYVYLRDGYTEPAPGSADPVYPGLILTEQRQVRLSTNFARAERGEGLAADVFDTSGDDQKIIDSLFIGAQRMYEKLPQPELLTQTLGQENLTPAKYRRLVRTEETNQVVSADYVFPSGLSGDQTQLRLEQETIIKARLKMIEEIIAVGADALIGGDTSEFGALAIYETVVNEGTAIDAGFLVLKSMVTPFGNGKAVKITTKYPLDLALRHLLTKSLGQDNLTPPKYRRLVQRQESNSMVDPATYVFPAGLSGDQVEVQYIEETIYRARLKLVDELIATSSDPLIGKQTGLYGVESIYETVVNDGTAADQGFLVARSTVTPFGNGKSLKITANYPADLATSIREGQRWDAQLKAYIPFQERIAPNGDEIGDFGKEIEPIDYERAKVTERSVTLPDPIISFGYRREQLPTTLLSLAIVGTETKEIVPTFLVPPDIFRARYTRTFSADAPDIDEPPRFWPQPFHGVVEYTETTNSDSSGSSTEDQSGTRSGTHSSTNNSSGNSSDSGVSSESGNSTESGTSSSTSAQSGTHSNTHSDTDSSSHTGTHSTTESATHSSTSSTTDSGNTTSGGTDGVTTSNSGAPLVGDPFVARTWNEDRSHSSTGSGTGSGTSSGTTSGTNTNSGTGSNSGTSSGTSSSTGADSGTHSGTRTHTSDTTHSGTRSSSDSSSSNGTSDSAETGHSNNSHTASNQITRLSLLRLTLPFCLHDDIVIGGFTLLATSPTELPWGEWLVVASNSEVGREGVWITDQIEIYLPMPDDTGSLLHFYYWNQIINLSGGNSITDLDGQLIATYGIHTIFEVNISGRGASQWSKELWDGVGTPLTDPDGGIIVTSDYSASTMNYILVRVWGW